MGSTFIRFYFQKRVASFQESENSSFSATFQFSACFSGTLPSQPYLAWICRLFVLCLTAFLLSLNCAQPDPNAVSANSQLDEL